MLIINDKIAIPWDEFDISYARSAGPGGQNVNKRETKAVLDWSMVDSPSIPPDVHRRFVGRYGMRLTNEGHIVIASDEHRSQEANLKACFEKLKEMLLNVAVAPKKRVATKPTKGSRQRRLTGKKLNADTKKNRQKITDY